MTFTLTGSISSVRTQKILAVAKFLNVEVHFDNNGKSKTTVLQTPQGELT